MGDKRYYKRYYYINGEWLEDPPDPPKDYDLAIFVCNKSEAADILKNKVSDSIIKNIKDNNTRSVFEDYNNYKYISLSIFNSYYFRTLVDKLLEGKPYSIIEHFRTLLVELLKLLLKLVDKLLNNLMTSKIINIAIVIFEKEFYVFADDILIDWINRVVDMFKQDVDKFKQEKRVLGSVFVYNVIFALMSELNLMLKYLDNKVYYIHKKIYEITKFEDLRTYINNLLKLRLYLTCIKEVLRKIRPLLREASKYYNELSDIKEECDDQLYRIEQYIQNIISTAFSLADLRQTEAIKLLTVISIVLFLITINNTYGQDLERSVLILLITIGLILILKYYI